MKKLGVAWIISVSAVGSLQAKYKPCDIVLPDQFLDRTKQSSAHSYFGRGIVGHIAFADPICMELQQLLLKSARALNLAFTMAALTSTWKGRLSAPGLNPSRITSSL